VKVEEQKPDPIRRILDECHTIAVVGLSDKPDRPSNDVALYLKEHGYRIIPVNPKLNEVLGERAYPDLLSIPGGIDVVDIFRRSEDVGPVVDGAIKKGAKVVWMQLGVINEEAAQKARAAGIEVVMDRCMKHEHVILHQQ
jgi:predicted CoA-binding protein